jgi:signal transduction histidine kinase/CheY-like chemotaxis protein
MTHENLTRDEAVPDIDESANASPDGERDVERVDPPGSSRDAASESAPITGWQFGRLSLGGQLTISNMATSGIALLLACGALFAFDAATSRKALLNDSGILADVIAANSSAAVVFDDARAAAETLQAAAINPHVLTAQIVRKGVVFATFSRSNQTEAPGVPRELADAIARGEPQQEFSPNALRMVRPIVFNHEVVGAFYMETDLDALSDRRNTFGQITLLVLIGTCTVALFLSLRLQRVILAPILHLTSVTRAFSGTRNYSVRARRFRNDEVGVLIGGFNEMLSEIEQRDRELRQHKAQLERTVETRTADLVAANQDLATARDAAMEGSRAKSEFLANMSHEIRTPMNGILGMTELALDSPLNEQQRDWLESARTSAGSLLTILNDILDFSKIESRRLDIEVVPMSLRDVVADALKTQAPTAHGKGLELMADVSGDVPSGVLGDPGRLGQVLVNLLSNAVKFTERGHVLVRVRVPAVLPDGRVRVRFSVSDTGIGIPADKHQLIFESFRQADGSTTRRFGGTGLGLTISSQLIALMGGSIEVESEPGLGSTFHVTLDLQTAAVPERQYNTDLAGLRALIVDDNPINGRIQSEFLARLGMIPVTATGGTDALDLLDRARDRQTPFDIVLMDANMPQMDGFTAAQRIVHEPGHPPVVMLTSTAGQGDSARCRAIGISEYLVKPVRQADLFDAMAAALSGRRPHPATAPQSKPSKPEATTHSRILLAEDNATNQKIVCGLLRPRHHVVEVVDNGADAVTAVERGMYDLVLMDLQMPIMGGLEATKAIRARDAERGRHTRIVALTAHAMKTDREECLAAGMDGYLAKPVSKKALLAVVEQNAAGVDAPGADGPDSTSIGALVGAGKSTRGEPG